MANEAAVTVTFHCKECGGTAIELPDDHTDDSIAKCHACGTEFGRYGDIKAKAREMALGRVTEHVRKMMKDAFKGSKVFKIK